MLGRRKVDPSRRAFAILFEAEESASCPQFDQPVIQHIINHAVSSMVLSGCQVVTQGLLLNAQEIGGDRGQVSEGVFAMAAIIR